MRPNKRSGGLGLLAAVESAGLSGRRKAAGKGSLSGISVGKASPEAASPRQSKKNSAKQNSVLEISGGGRAGGVSSAPRNASASAARKQTAAPGLAARKYPAVPPEPAPKKAALKRSVGGVSAPEAAVPALAAEYLASASVSTSTARKRAAGGAHEVPLREPAPKKTALKRSFEVPLRIIGVDPGLASTGWGVLESSKGRLRYIAHGCIETGAEMPRGERLLLIYTSFLKVLKTYKPEQAAIENLYFGKNISSAMVVAEARGVLLMALNARGLSVRELTPNAIKQAVAGVTRAEKKQIQEMVRFILGLPEIPKPDHAADALGAAICAAHEGAWHHKENICPEYWKPRN